ncbi:cytosine deaminase [Pseudooceanicola algae]|uniref:Pterin deaminase n=1 Tax=Pseudooceanicola algae TaxID=1537215 RepID=A0A418SD43_9RHOB|nr:cytosine deaminase [Pseudooceanicola algae]QPM92324.1 Pterin deaminase [Pseudooceanicola algae]
MDFKTLPDGPLALRGVTLPACLLGQEGGLIRTDIGIADGKIAAPAGTDVDMGSAMLLPCFTDMHTHLDKGHIWPRASNPDGTFDGALKTVRADHALWSAEDVRARMSFALRCAHAHGTARIRTHLDSLEGQYLRSFPVFTEMRAEWAGRIDLQASSLVSCDRVARGGEFADLLRVVAEADATFGLVSYPIPDLKDRLLTFFDMAGSAGVSVDFHTDETMDPSSETLRLIAECVIETGFDGGVVVGHCCSVSTQDEARAMSTLDLIAKAGLNVVSLPMCNLFLQDRHAGRTPRNRGVTLVHEMKARGISVSFASDNTRDPFYAYGDLDMVEVLREATRIAHLDHSDPDWIHSFTTTPAAACGFEAEGLTIGAPADMILFPARDWTELFARPQANRIVLRDGKAIDRTLPDYSELDHLMRAK